MPIPETFQLNNEQCNLFLKQINDKQAKIINPKTGREIKNKQNIDKIVKWCNMLTNVVHPIRRDHR